MTDATFTHHRAVLDAMIRAHCAPHDPKGIVFDGALHRFRVDGDKPGSRNGWFVLYADGLPAGVFGSWKTGASETWCAREEKTLTPAERLERDQRMAAAQARRRQEAQARHEQARTRATLLWERSRVLVDAHHPYLLKKQIPAIGIRQRKTVLVVPVRDLDGALHSLEFINPAGGKQFLKGGAVEGHGQVLGNLQGARTILLCEGYATGVSLHRASGVSVVVCFHAGNLTPVALHVRQHYPHAALMMAADDDQYTKGNPGKTAAEQAARRVGGSVFLPDFTGLDTRSAPTDFNDVHVLGGLAHLKAQIQAALPNTRVPAPAPDRKRLTPASTQPPESPAQPTTDPKRRIEMAAFSRRSTERGDERSGRGGRRGGGASRNLYQDVTERIIEMIENGTAPWQRPWEGSRHPLVPAWPVNAVTGKSYQGINRLLLQGNGSAVDDPRWCGYQQAQAKGWQVKAGERGTSVYFYKPLEITAKADDLDRGPLLDDDGRAIRQTIPLLRRHTVFHASQIEGIPSLEDVYGMPEGMQIDHAWAREQHLEDRLTRSGARILHRGLRAFYSPGEDCIYLPPRERFPHGGHYYGIAYHELAHWSGHQTRLNRPFSFDRNSPHYAREELRAELASAFLGAELGIQHDLEVHAAYLDLYLALLRRDPKEIFRAAKDAQGIADLILDRHPTWQLHQGVCVPRAEPLPVERSVPSGVEPTATLESEALPEERLPPLSGPEKSSQIRLDGGKSATTEALSAHARPYRWAAAALQALESSDEDGGQWSRLFYQIDAAFREQSATMLAISRPSGRPTPAG